MKKFLLSLALISASLISFAQDVTIDKEKCTITKYGKTYPLYGKVQIVEDYPDFTVKITDDFYDLVIKETGNVQCECGEYRLSDDYPDIRIKIVDDYPDIRVRYAGWNEFPGLR